MRLLFCFLPLLTGLFTLSTLAENPQWIWHDNHGVAIKPDEARYFRKTFNVSANPTKALLTIAADDECDVYLNGKKVTHQSDFAHPAREDVTKYIKKEQNLIAVRGHNIGSDVAGVVAMLELRTGKGKTDFIVTDDSWLSAPKEEAGW